LSSANSADGGPCVGKVNVISEEHYIEQIQQLSEKVWTI
jgi:RP/EB family microtubule-associated protein